jgi:hypothetical protein
MLRFVRSTMSGVVMMVVATVMMFGAMNAAADDLVSVMMSAMGREPMQTMTQDCDASVGSNQQKRHELSGNASHGISQCWQRLAASELPGQIKAYAKIMRPSSRHS